MFGFVIIYLELSAILLYDSVPLQQTPNRVWVHHNPKYRLEYPQVVDEIRQNTEKIVGDKAQFITTILAEEYYQTKRLRH